MIAAALVFFGCCYLVIGIIVAVATTVGFNDTNTVTAINQFWKFVAYAIVFTLVMFFWPILIGGFIGGLILGR